MKKICMINIILSSITFMFIWFGLDTYSANELGGLLATKVIKIVYQM